MKKLILMLAIVALALPSCMNSKKIGEINMISNRNIDSHGEYVNLKNYVGGSRKELRRLKAPTLEIAIDKVVKTVPGGEFLKNVRIYVVNSKYYAVEGDVWGYAQQAKK